MEDEFTGDDGGGRAEIDGESDVIGGGFGAITGRTFPA